MLGVILGILTFVVVLYLDTKSDYKRIPTGNVSHGRGQVIRILALIPSFVCFMLPVHDESISVVIIKMFITAAMMAAWWWEFFDGWLNKIRGYSWRYNGSDDVDDAKSDNFLQQFSPKEQMIIKWGLIILFTSLYTIFIRC